MMSLQPDPDCQDACDGPRRPERGFTLIEVLVALVVTSMLLTIVMNAVLQAKARSVAARDKQEAAMLAGSLIAGRTIAPFDPAAREGESGGLRWTVSERSIAADPRGLLLLAQIEVRVRNARGVALAALETRKIKPAPRT